MMDILMYLFETYIHSDVELLMDQDELTDELTRAGFQENEIYKAYDWLESLAGLQENEGQSYLTTPCSNRSFRIYTEDEMYRIDCESRGFMLHLEQVKILDSELREMVIDQIMALDTQQFSLNDLKWIVLMVLFNASGYEGAYQQMEDLLYDGDDAWPSH
ncbi:DUF494 family protein [Vibrio sp. SS-MA-C1-2]|uniref:DUF494 family protein n=1 Tax=Vibrio sp. SS-MA-C1-2 TaxID=2908646 RepID=UPI001F35A343|nr:DUF494 family protein [Vibrio sp. SS-MA-C1-2]UJF19360.1 DUF494 family protein [Vibrio sp. SS-MA-C1-2]